MTVKGCTSHDIFDYCQAMNSGVSASFMSSLAKANVNIRVIAQGSSERQVAVVVEAKDGAFFSLQ